MIDPYTDMEINYRAQISILEACRKYNPKIRIVFASTRQIYGKPEYLPVDERHPLRPVDANGINKLAGEQFHLLYNNNYDIRSTVLRLTNTIGPRMRIKDSRQTFVGTWINSAIQGKIYQVWGGSQMRDFTYVDDVVEAFLLAAIAEDSIGKVINIGGLGSISLISLAEMLSSLANDCEFNVLQYPAEREKIDIGNYIADYELAKNLLNWRPNFTIARSIESTVKYYKEYYKWYI